MQNAAVNNSQEFVKRNTNEIVKAQEKQIANKIKSNIRSLLRKLDDS